MATPLIHFLLVDFIIKQYMDKSAATEIPKICVLVDYAITSDLRLMLVEKFGILVSVIDIERAETGMNLTTYDLVIVFTSKTFRRMNPVQLASRFHRLGHKIPDVYFASTDDRNEHPVVHSSALSLGEMLTELGIIVSWYDKMLEA